MQSCLFQRMVCSNIIDVYADLIYAPTSQSTNYYENLLATKGMGTEPERF